MRTPYRKPGKYTHLSIDPLMTEGKFHDLKHEFERLKKIQPEAAKEVNRLSELGDFSENVEYQLAKGRLRGINSAILKLQKQLDQAVIIDAPTETNEIQVGHAVTTESNGQQKIYQILGSAETAPDQGIVSHQSPLGVSLLGRKLGEKVKMKLGNREVEYTIMKIE